MPKLKLSSDYLFDITGHALCREVNGSNSMENAVRLKLDVDIFGEEPNNKMEAEFKSKFIEKLKNSSQVYSNKEEDHFYSVYEQYMDLNRGSIIPLASEAQAQAGTVFNAIDQLLKEKGWYEALDEKAIKNWDKAKAEYIKQANNLAWDAFGHVMMQNISATSGCLSSAVTVESINKAIDAARPQLQKNIHKALVGTVCSVFDDEESKKYFHAFIDIFSKRNDANTQVWAKREGYDGKDKSLTDPERLISLLTLKTNDEADFLQSNQLPDGKVSCVRVKGTKHTSHTRNFGEDQLAIREVIYRFYDKDETQKQKSTDWVRLKNQELTGRILRATSFPVFLKDENGEEIPPPVDSIQEEACIADIVSKMKAVSKHLEDRSAPNTPVIHNVLMSKRIFFWREREVYHYQAQRIGLTLKAAHLFNKGRINEGRSSPKDFTFILQGGVNHHEVDDKPDGGNPWDLVGGDANINKEALIMKELSLVSILTQRVDLLPRFNDSSENETAPLLSSRFNLKQVINSLYGNMMNNYNAFLRSPSSDLFFNTSFGKDAIEEIKAFKKTMNEKLRDMDVNEVNSVEKAAVTSLLTMLVLGDYKKSEHQTTLQSLAIFCQKKSVVYCKSGNERTKAILQRVESLKATNAGLQCDESKELFNSMKKYVADSSQHGMNYSLSSAINSMSSSLHSLYDKHFLYGASVDISHQGQGADTKYGKKDLSLNANKGDSGATNSSVEYASSWQAHKMGRALYDNLSKACDDKRPKGEAAKSSREVREQMVMGKVANTAKDLELYDRCFREGSLRDLVNCVGNAFNMTNSNSVRSLENRYVTTRAVYDNRFINTKCKTPDLVCDLLRLQIETDDKFYDVKSYYTTVDLWNPDSKKYESQPLLIRDEREKGALLKEEKVNLENELDDKSKKEKSDPRYKKMVVAEAIACSDILRTYDILESDIHDKITKMSQDFCNIIDTNSDNLVRSVKGYHNAYLFFVNEMLIPFLRQTLDDNQKGSFTKKEALRKLTVAKDLVIMHYQPHLVASIRPVSELDPADPLSLYNIKIENPLTSLTSDQIEQINDCENQGWFKNMTSLQKSMFKLHKDRMLTGKQVIPSQTRNFLPCCKNSVQQISALCSNNYKPISISSISRVGGLPTLERGAFNPKITPQKYNFAKNRLTAISQVMEKGKYKDTMLQTTVDNLKQLKKYAQQHYKSNMPWLFDEGGNLSVSKLIIHKEDLTSQWVASTVFRDEVDMYISAYTDKAVEVLSNKGKAVEALSNKEDSGGVHFWHSQVCVSPVHPVEDNSGIDKILKKELVPQANKVIQEISSKCALYPSNPDLNRVRRLLEFLRYYNKELKSHIPQSIDVRDHGKRRQKVSRFGKMIKVIFDHLHHMLYALQQNNNKDLGIYDQVKMFIPLIFHAHGCASAENRTTVQEEDFMISVLLNNLDLDPNKAVGEMKIRDLLAGHLHYQAEHGGTPGRAGTRPQSAVADHTTKNYYKDTDIRKLMELPLGDAKDADVKDKDKASYEEVKDKIMAFEGIDDQLKGLNVNVENLSFIDEQSFYLKQAKKENNFYWRKGKNGAEVDYTRQKATFETAFSVLSPELVGEHFTIQTSDDIKYGVLNSFKLDEEKSKCENLIDLIVCTHDFTPPDELKQCQQTGLVEATYHSPLISKSESSRDHNNRLTIKCTSRPSDTKSGSSPIPNEQRIEEAKAEKGTNLAISALAKLAMNEKKFENMAKSSWLGKTRWFSSGSWFSSSYSPLYITGNDTMAKLTLALQLASTGELKLDSFGGWFSYKWTKVIWDGWKKELDSYFGDIFSESNPDESADESAEKMKEKMKKEMKDKLTYLFQAHEKQSENVQYKHQAAYVNVVQTFKRQLEDYIEPPNDLRSSVGFSTQCPSHVSSKRNSSGFFDSFSGRSSNAVNHELKEPLLSENSSNTNNNK